MVIVRKLAYILFFSYCLLNSSCGEVRLKRFTPKEFVNNVNVPRAQYIRDSIQIQDTLKSYLKEHRYSFYSKEYFDSTQIIIDTIIYDNSHKKFIVFVMVKNPTNRQVQPNSNWYFDATSYIGAKSGEDIRLAWVGPNFSNAVNQSELSNIIRSAYFTEFATSDTIGNNMYKYNMNDTRFWQSSIWEKINKVSGESR
ncbi:hypothetical protein [Chitinophaga niabensis]|uniref:Uncharacterized protein n=1 Tax=Chitinophaga niabensis TaxID=536979 RepID=A0A1N6KG84_9BACT|nr:hypothetical protein [Chitinophaga niabensis]SIO55548.1 hypothetical protein SAMN04488055_5784 [Chitinophaga niabensis]